MNYLKTLLPYGVLIIISCLIYTLIRLQANPTLITVVVISTSALKIGLFGFMIFKRLLLITHNIKYLKFLSFIGINILYLVFSFAIDYYFIFKLNPLAFTGLEEANSTYEVLFKMFYLSFLLFTNMGVANVVPISIPAECVVMFEAITSFATIIFILSDYVSLKDALVRWRE